MKPSKTFNYVTAVIQIIMFDSINSASNIQKMKEEYLEMEKKLQPIVVEKLKSPQNLSYLEFLNSILDSLKVHPWAQSVRVKLEIGEKEYQFTQPGNEILPFVLSMVKGSKDQGEWVEPDNYRNITGEGYQMLSWLMDGFIETTKLQKNLGWKSTDLELKMNDKKYYTLMDIDKAIAYLESFRSKTDDSAPPIN